MTGLSSVAKLWFCTELAYTYYIITPILEYTVSAQKVLQVVMAMVK